MDWDAIAPMFVGVCFILTTGGVLILRPLAKRVSDLLDVYARDRREGLENEVRQVRELLETMDNRLRLMEERQDFTDRLLTAGKGESAQDPEKE